MFGSEPNDTGDGWVRLATTGTSWLSGTASASGVRNDGINELDRTSAPFRDRHELQHGGHEFVRHVHTQLVEALTELFGLGRWRLHRRGEGCGLSPLPSYCAAKVLNSLRTASMPASPPPALRYRDSNPGWRYERERPGLPIFTLSPPVLRSALTMISSGSSRPFSFLILGTHRLERIGRSSLVEVLTNDCAGQPALRICSHRAAVTPA